MADRSIETEAEINWIRLIVQGSDPAADAAGYARLYVKATGLHIVLPGGAVIGPLISATLTEQASPSAPAANKLILYAKDDGGVTRLYYKNSDDTEFKIPYLLTEMFDFPASYAGAGSDTLKVTAGEDGVEFVP